mmetsp:Transcript_6001/g.8123  ORF Transcript_6001/g.8123 Transcript_6001/m.8123 type:complete len:81 (+) Transcript_6001:606-848(+)
MKQEFMNVQLLIKFGADVNAQDIRGNSLLHLAVMRIAASPDDFDNYKKKSSRSYSSMEPIWTYGRCKETRHATFSTISTI